MVNETQSRMIYNENKGERAIRQNKQKRTIKSWKKNKSGKDIYERQQPEQNNADGYKRR